MCVKIHTVNRYFHHFQRTMQGLALVALALMLCMPVLSRWQQGMKDPSAEMCLSGDVRAVLLDDSRTHTHHHPVNGESPPHDHAHSHDVCGYCTLATRLLPVLVLVLAVSLPPPERHSPRLPQRTVPAVPDWPAHSPRGPPLYS